MIRTVFVLLAGLLSTASAQRTGTRAIEPGIRPSGDSRASAGAVPSGYRVEQPLSVPDDRTPKPLGRFGYTIEWRILSSQYYFLGVTQAQDTLIWAASYWKSPGDTTKRILVYDIATRVGVDTFLSPSQSQYGYLDMTYVPSTNMVYGVSSYIGYERDTLDAIDATTHNLGAQYHITGPEPCSDPGGIGFDGESLYVVSFNTANIYKLAIDGTNCHKVGRTELAYPGGLGVDRTHGAVYVSELSYPPSRLASYSYSGLQLQDMWDPAEAPQLTGCETWRDSLLLIACPGSGVYCFRLTPNPVDVGPTAILAPDSIMTVDSLYPSVCVTNLGEAATGGFPVYCRIDSAGVRVNDDTAECDPLMGYQRRNVTFPRLWRVADGSSYDITFITCTDRDSNCANDTIRRTVTVSIAEQGTTPNALRSRLEVSPNPFRDRILVECHAPGPGGTVLELYDAAGRLVDRVRLGSGQTRAGFPTKGTAPGQNVYFVRMRSGSSCVTRKVSRVE